jgi:hypothetical protein
MTRSLALIAGFALAAAAPERGADDPLVVDSKWVGKLTQKGKIEGNETPLTLDAELRITKRDGTKFEAELLESNDVIRVTYLVKGTVVKAKDGKSFAVEFKNYDFKDTESQTFLDIPYTGKLEGKKLTGTWKHPKNDNDTTLEGDFTLEKK